MAGWGHYLTGWKLYLFFQKAAAGNFAL